MIKTKTKVNTPKGIGIVCGIQLIESEKDRTAEKYFVVVGGKILTFLPNEIELIDESKQL